MQMNMFVWLWATAQLLITCVSFMMDSRFVSGAAERYENAG